MYAEKVLIDWSEYQRLKSCEKKYVQLKKQLDRHASLGEQSGQGHEQSLEKLILTQENENDNVPKKQEIVPPITTPPEAQDIDSPLPPKVGESESKKQEVKRLPPKTGESGSKEPETKKKKRKNKSEPVPSNGKWFFIGVPKYKH